MLARPAAVRPGVSLLESLIAGAILFISLASIYSLLDTASKHTNTVRERSLAIQFAQSKLNEIACGAIGLTGQSGEVEGMEGWEYAVEAQQYEVAGLWKVVVRVRRSSGGEFDAAVLESMVLDPAKRGSPLDETKVETGGDTTESDKADSPTTPSTGTGGTGSGGMGGTTPTPLPMGGGSRPSGGGQTGGAGQTGGGMRN